MKVIVCIVFFVIHILNIYGDKLILSSVLFRHGDRTPTRLIPGDLNMWPQGLGQLTNLGVYQEVELGKFLRSVYEEYINDMYNVSEVYLRSTNIDRALMSGISVLTGLYPSSKDVENITGLSFQPVPLHSVLEKNDFMLTNKYKLCKNFIDLENKTTTSSAYISYMQSWQSDFDYISSQTGQPVTFKDLYEFADALFIEKLKSRKWPVWVTEDFFNRIMIARRESFYISFGMPGYIPYYGGAHLEKIIQHMKATLSRASPIKLFIYSGHDSNIASILMALNVFDNSSIPYSACVMIELYERLDNSSSEFFIQVYLRNGTGSDRQLLTLPGCSSSCPWNHFLAIVKDNLPGNYSSMCGSELWPWRKMLEVFLISFTGGLGIMSLIVIIVLCCRRKYLQKSYHFKSYKVVEVDAKAEHVPILVAEDSDMEY